MLTVDCEQYLLQTSPSLLMPEEVILSFLLQSLSTPSCTFSSSQPTFLDSQRFRHTPLNTRLSQPRNNKRRPLLYRRPPHRKEPRNRMRRPIRLLNQINSNPPPSTKRRKHPKVTRGFNPHPHAPRQPVSGSRQRVRGGAVVGEEAAGDGGADGEGG